MPQHQNQVPGKRQPADHQSSYSKRRTPKFCPNHTQRVEDERKKAQKRTATNETSQTKDRRQKAPDPAPTKKRKSTRQTSKPDKDKKGDTRERISKADRISSHMKTKGGKVLQSTPDRRRTQETPRKIGRGGQTKSHRSLGTKKEGVQKQPK